MWLEKLSGERYCNTKGKEESVSCSLLAFRQSRMGIYHVQLSTSERAWGFIYFSPKRPNTNTVQARGLCIGSQWKKKSDFQKKQHSNRLSDLIAFGGICSTPPHWFEATCTLRLFRQISSEWGLSLIILTCRRYLNKTGIIFTFWWERSTVALLVRLVWAAQLCIISEVRVLLWSDSWKIGNLISLTTHSWPWLNVHGREFVPVVGEKDVCLGVDGVGDVGVWEI